MKSSTQDTIAAISTPPGEGGIGIIRISGPEAFPIALELFRPVLNRDEVESHKMKLGKLVKPDSGEIIDEVMMVAMRAPNSYTADDTVEFHSHGSMMTLSLILREILDMGTRMAEPGEFTKRAFLNGRMDLTRAEAVISVIKASSEGSLKAAIKQLDGGLQKTITDFRKELIELLAQVEADIDFPEEEIETIPPEEVETVTSNIYGKIDALRKTYQKGKILREGIETAIAGRPNVGKSSLLNALLNFEKAIVTPHPGTTRDIVEDAVNIRGITLKIMDTAGIRDHDNDVEKEGIRRTRKALKEADLVLAVFDGSEELTEEDLEIIRSIKDKKVIPVINKCDLPKKIDLQKGGPFFSEAAPISVSSKTREGLDLIEEAIYEKIWHSKIDLTENLLITRLRHEEKLHQASTALVGVLKSIEGSLPLEFIAADIRAALDSLGEITGESYTEAVLDKIFSEFCIGK